MGFVIFIVVMASVFLTISIFLFFGKGSWLIAGYNTASAEEKARYNKKKLCRAVGAITLIIALLLYIMSYLGYRVESGFMDEDQMLPFAIIFIVVVLSAILIGSFYINRKCKNE